MGRHRRAHRAPVVHDPALHSATEDSRASHRGRRRVPVRTGLLGISAAAAVGTVAVTSGLVPGPGSLGGTDDPASTVRADATPSFPAPSTRSDAAQDREERAASRDEQRAEPGATPSPSRKPTGEDAARASADPADRGGAPEEDAASGTGGGNGGERPESSAPPASTPPAAPTPVRPAPEPTPDNPAPTPPGDDGAHSATEARVLTLVNQERARAGCQPLRADAALAGLAGDHSRDMAERGYFSHTDPEGRSPFDRAAEAGVRHMGGENIARGQATPEAVMEAWMNSPGHRANIVNCDFTTLGVGVHNGDGGPWWTQAFGY
ncbi:MULTISPECIES: CAP domain-containing protein [Streptomyces]|uniref:CAP domain-containing protein n=1 Tax=Streptomyces TaxID=1883 RepID=UPI00224913AC|nr:CAP domain-containing protein [Streptomyces sp. JHD 1]MCX2967500.1 CAP domain-containing protein [Streptomyces sp. JHD 1]